MADKTYKLNISKSDGSFSDSVQFTIPQREGTYKVEFELSNGNKVNAGNINVSTVEKTYKAEFQLSDGSKINGGTFTTPVAEGWHTVWTGNTEFKQSFRTSIEEQIAGYYGIKSISFNEITIDKPTRIDFTIENSAGTVKTETAFVVENNISNMLFETNNPTSIIKEYSISVSIVNQLLEFTFSAFTNKPRQTVNPASVGYVKLTKIEQFY